MTRLAVASVLPYLCLIFLANECPCLTRNRSAAQIRVTLRKLGDFRPVEQESFSRTVLRRHAAVITRVMTWLALASVLPYLYLIFLTNECPCLTRNRSAAQIRVTLRD